jgi:hypothetical protein
MSAKKVVNLTKEIESKFWFRYLPETTYKTYLMMAHLKMKGLEGEEATNKLLTTIFAIESETGKLKEEKERVINKLGIKYPTNRVEDLDILLKYNLIKESKSENGELVYTHKFPIQNPEEVLNLDEEEKSILENIRFEIKHQNAFNNILTLLINSNGNLLTSLEYIYDTTKVKLADIKEVLAYLVEEGSISVKADKDVKSLRKADKVYVSINKEVFEQKRFVIS